jgi:D-alanyl-D-alanine carboxypeptidase/D-alanyl-D-alanine-endopeptidase (penicillin-binding protein 4)
MPYFLLLLSLFVSTDALAYDKLSLLPQGSRTALFVRTEHGRPYTYNTDQLFPPASTLKIITALAAKLELGDDFQFETRLEAFNDDIVLRFSGDPTLTNADIERLIQELARSGIKNIQGDIVLDGSIFTGYERAVGWPWDILGVCYSAPSSAMTLDGNCVQASIYTNKDGSTRVYVPEHQPISVQTDAIALSKNEQKEKQCQLELLTSEINSYQLSGCLVERKKPLPLKFAVQDTFYYTKTLLQRALTTQGITLKGDIVQGSRERGIRIASHYSASLNELLGTMLTKSNNLYADNITKTLGARFYSQAGSYSNGIEAIKQIIFSNSGIDLNDAQLVDGSGLSRNNRITASDMSAVLSYIWKHDDQLQLLSLLPVSGESGTLQFRRSMRQPPIKGQIVAKSGSVYGSYNMAGYVLNNKKKPKALFVQFVSDYFPKKEESDTPSLPAIFRFEKALYQDLIKLSPKSSSLQ